MIISYNNLYDLQALITSSEVEGYEVENTQHIHLSKYWKTTGITDEWVKFSGIMTPESIFIAGTNLTDNAIVKLQGNDSDTWSSPTVDITLVKGENGVWSNTTTLSEQDYWRVSIVDTTNSASYLTIGRISIGPKVEVEGPYIKFVEEQINTSATTISISGQVYGDIGYEYKQYSFTFPWWDADEKEAIELFSKTVNKAQPFFIVAETLGPLYCILTNNIQFNHLKNLDVWTSTLDLMEAK